jgi:adenylate cyclase
MHKSDPGVEARWKRELTVGHRPFRLARTFMRMLPTDPRCKICNNPFGGVGGAIVGLAGFKPSRKNPNICQACCEKMPQGGAEVELAILFADVRGSTALAEEMSSTDFADLLNRFYLTATRALIRHDAIIDKLVGDEVMALFIPGFCGRTYRRRAAEAAVDLMKAVGHGSREGPWLPVGVGVHAGVAFVGNLGADGLVDLTALGDAVNTASRLQRSATAGEIVVSEGIYSEIRDRLPGGEAQIMSVRGKEEQIRVRTIRV